MTSPELAEIFSEEVSRPSEVEGDAHGVDATTEDILRLLDTPPDQLTADDFLGYLGYCTTGGDDDLRFLFPPILRIWEGELYQGESWFTQHFHAELCRTDFVERALSDRLRQAVIEFMIRALSGRLAAEQLLSVHGASASHDWFGYFASFGVFTTAIPSLWGRLWRSGEPGHAVALLQYLSCLLYDDDTNPIFAPWTCGEGGGAPELWGYDSVGSGDHWKEENRDFFSSALNSESIYQWLQLTVRSHSGSEIGTVASDFLHQLDDRAAEVDQRIELLLIALGIPSDVGLVSWESLLDVATQADADARS